MDESDKLQCWFSLSYASFLTLPRVLMEDMPVGWQDKMADLLSEYDEAYPNQPEIGTRVQAVKEGKLTKFPQFLLNYRRPDTEAIQALKRETNNPVDNICVELAKPTHEDSPQGHKSRQGIVT